MRAPLLPLLLPDWEAMAAGVRLATDLGCCGGASASLSLIPGCTCEGNVHAARGWARMMGGWVAQLDGPKSVAIARSLHVVHHRRIAVHQLERRGARWVQP